MEHTVQTRLGLYREELQSRAQLVFNKTAVILGAPVIFEIMADYSSWFYPPGSVLGHLEWTILLVGVIFLTVEVFSLFKEFSAQEGPRSDLHDSKELVIAACSHCRAIYHYLSADKELAC